MTRTPSPRRRILTHFVLGIALPSCLLGYLAFRGVRNDQALLDRERRLELESAAAAVSAAVESRLEELDRALDSAVAAGAASPRMAELMDTLVATEPLLEAVFLLEAGGGATVVSGGRFVASDPDWWGPDGRAPWPGLDAARMAEARGDDAPRALASYRRLLDRAPDARGSADALAGIARTAGRAGLHGEAAAAWRRLSDEYGHVRNAGGLPLAPVGRLELGRALIEAGDTAASVEVLLGFYGRLVDGEWRLTRPQFEMLADRVRTIAAPLPGAADSLAALAEAERWLRHRADQLALFVDLVGGLSGTDPAVPRRMVLEGRDREYHVSLRPARPGEGGGRWGLLLDPDSLRTRLLVPALESSAGAGDFDWTLRARDGRTLAASAAAGRGSHDAGDGADDRSDAALTASLPATLAAWTVAFDQPVPGLAETLLTTQRGVYFYAFLLLAGILVFGLTLTIRSVSHELSLARMQSDFVSTVSHEFKSPLTAIRQLTEMLRADRVPSEERRRRYYDVLLEQSERLSMLVDNVLDFARMEEGRRTLDLSVVAPCELVEAAAALARQRVAHDGFDIEARVEDGLPPVAVDRGAMGQALGNLIDNAVKYSGESRRVLVGATAGPGEVVLFVRDHGIGLRPEDALRVFDRFFRAGDPLTRTVKGTGLGLTLVRQIAEAHGGSVAVESEPGRGSTFLLRLPAETREAEWLGS